MKRTSHHVKIDLSKFNQCTRSSSVPRLDGIMVFFAKGAMPGAWYREWNVILLTKWTDGRKNGQTVANSIAPLPHFVRRGTIKQFTPHKGYHCLFSYKTTEQSMKKLNDNQLTGNGFHEMIWYSHHDMIIMAVIWQQTHFIFMMCIFLCHPL